MRYRNLFTSLEIFLRNIDNFSLICFPVYLEFERVPIDYITKTSHTLNGLRTLKIQYFS